MQRRPALYLTIIVVFAVVSGDSPAGAESAPPRDFNDGSWASGLTDLRANDLGNSVVVGAGFDGSGLEVNIPRGSFRGVGPFDRLPESASQAWYRYHIQLLSFDTKSSGKLPGLSGLYSHTAKGCFPSKPGAPGWSARGLFGAAGSKGAPAGQVPIGIYLYHLNQPGSCGEALYWENSSLQPGRWHCIEGHVKLNTPGSNDGIVQGWLDGTLRFSRDGLAFRRAYEAGVGIRELWLDVYYGGKRPTPNPLRLVIDEVAVSTEGRVGCLDSYTDLVGSFDGGKQAAIATYAPDTGSWMVNTWRGTGFDAETWASFSTKTDWTAHLVGDFSGNGKDEIASYHPTNGAWWVSSSAGSGFATARWGTFNSKTGWGAQLVGDFTGNGRDEIASYHLGNGTWWVSGSTSPRPDPLKGKARWIDKLTGDSSGSTRFVPTHFHATAVSPDPQTPDEGFSTRLWGAFRTTTGWSSQVAGDFNGDGIDDIANYHPGSGTWWVGISTGDSFNSSVWGAFSTKSGWSSQVVGDFNGDGRDDIANYHPGTGAWWVSLSNGEGFTTERWATFTTRAGWTTQVVGDFNGDSRDDIANYHPGSGSWWVSISDGDGFTTDRWANFNTTTGWTSQIVGDFNGDGRDDIANYHAHSGRRWVSSSTGTSFITANWTPP